MSPGQKRVRIYLKFSQQFEATFERFLLTFSGDNFVGVIYRILYKDANETSGKEQSSLILKIAPTDPFRREMQKLRELFLREISIYDEVMIPY